MKNLLIGIAALVVIGLGWFLFSDSDKFDYVVTIENEIEQLETELMEIDAAVEAGALTTAEATEAKVKIITRLDTINTTVAASTGAKLTPAQQQQLNDGLNRLKTILINYQATLTTLDKSADEAMVKAKVKTGGAGKSLTSIMAVTIANVEADVEEYVEDYMADEELDEQVEIIIDEESTDNTDYSEEVTGDEGMTEEEIEDDSATSTETESGVIEQNGTSTDETIDTEIEAEVVL